LPTAKVRLAFTANISGSGPCNLASIAPWVENFTVLPTKKYPAVVQGSITYMAISGLLKFMASHPLTRDNQFQAFARFAKRQISSRLAPGVIVYEWIDGSKFLVRRGETGLTGNIYAGLHEFAEMGYLLYLKRLVPSAAIDA
jgi:hypothetical protein